LLRNSLRNRTGNYFGGTGNFGAATGILLAKTEIVARRGFRYTQPTKAGPMPTDERRGADERNDLQDRRKPSIQLDKEQAIAVRKPHAPMYHPAQQNHLVSERSIFGFKPALRLEWRDQDGQDKT
jgi:hypothetical protein